MGQCHVSVHAHVHMLEHIAWSLDKGKAHLLVAIKWPRHLRAHWHTDITVSYQVQAVHLNILQIKKIQGTNFSNVDSY